MELPQTQPQALPQDCIRTIASYVPEQQWPQCMRVCKEWYIGFNHPKQDSGENDIIDGNIITYKHYVMKKENVDDDFALCILYGYIGLARWLSRHKRLTIRPACVRMRDRLFAESHSHEDFTDSSCKFCRFGANLARYQGIGTVHTICNIASQFHHDGTLDAEFEPTTVESRLIKTPAVALFKQYLSNDPPAVRIMHLMCEIPRNIVMRWMKQICDSLFLELRSRILSRVYGLNGIVSAEMERRHYST